MLVLPGETVCRKCGAYIEIPDEIKEKMKRKVEYTVCSECGAEVPMDARRCPKCGASFDEDTEEVEVEATEAEIAERVERQENEEIFYSMSLAMGIMITYGSYMKKYFSTHPPMTQ